MGRSENNQAATSDQKRYAHMILLLRVLQDGVRKGVARSRPRFEKLGGR